MKHNKRFDVIYLHIGLGKTGSTYIQEDLVSAADLLEREHDLHYPRGFLHAAEFNGNHSFLLRALFFDDPDVRRRLAAAGLPALKDIETYNEQTLRQMHKGIAESKASKMLLSAEGIGHFKRPQLKQLADWLYELTDRVKIVACVRDPVKALSSEIQQRLSVGEVLEDLYENPPFYKFENLFKRIEQAFGKEDILVYSFETAVSSKHSLTSFFLSSIGLDLDDAFPKRAPVNSSLSHEAATLLSAYNRFYPILVDGEENPKRQSAILDFFYSVPGRKYTAPNEIYRLVERQVQSELEWLKSRYQIEFSSIEPVEEVDHGSFTGPAIQYLVERIADGAALQESVDSDLPMKRAGSFESSGYWRRIWHRVRVIFAKTG